MYEWGWEYFPRMDVDVVVRKEKKVKKKLSVKFPQEFGTDTLEDLWEDGDALLAKDRDGDTCIYLQSFGKIFAIYNDGRISNILSGKRLDRTGKKYRIKGVEVSLEEA